MTPWLIADVRPFIDEVLACCPMIRAVWLVADEPGGDRDAARLHTWDLIALADPLTLHRLRRAVRLHRNDVRLRVLSDGNRLEAVWGSRHAVRIASDWQPLTQGEGYYTESAAAAGPLQAAGGGTRRKAICVWQGIDAMKGPGS